MRDEEDIQNRPANSHVHACIIPDIEVHANGIGTDA